MEIGAPGLTLRSRTTGAGRAAIVARGELDLATADSLYEYARDVVDRHGTAVVLDLSELTFCDARGLGCLVAIGNHAAAAGCSFSLADPSPAVVRVLQITRLDSRFPVAYATNGDGRAKGGARHVIDARAGGPTDGRADGRVDGDGRRSASNCSSVDPAGRVTAAVESLVRSPLTRLSPCPGR